MNLELNELLAGKPTRIKNKEYFSTEAYVTPFLDKMSKVTDEFIIQARLPNQISLTRDNNVNLDDVVYNRVWVQAVLPDEYCWDNHKRVISMLYALDTRKPVVKMYTGALNSACLNLCVFDPECLHVAELEPETAIDFKPLKGIISIADSIHSNLEKLDKMSFTQENIYNSLGHWIDNCIKYDYNSGFGKVKLAEDTPVEAYKSIFYDTNSPYYTSNGEVDGFTVYNAFTQLITNDSRDLVNKFEKTLLIKNILGI